MFGPLHVIGVLILLVSFLLHSYILFTKGEKSQAIRWTSKLTLVAGLLILWSLTPLKPQS